MLSLRNLISTGKGSFTALVIVCVFLLVLSFSVQSVHAHFNGGKPALVETQWLADNLKNPDIRIVHVGSLNPESEKYFNMKHIPGSIYLGIGELMGVMGNGSAAPDKAMSEAMMGRLGISDNTHVIIVGGSDNPFTVAALWVMKYNGHTTVSFLNGGMGKWMKESRSTTAGPAKVKPTQYSASPDTSIYSSADYVLKNIKNSGVKIVDVRTQGEFVGKDNPSQIKRTGHVPGALNMEFYSTNLNGNGTFKSSADLAAAYEAKGITKDKEIVLYCEGGVRASHTYFVLKHLLGYPNVKNYVGSWGEWGNRLDPATYPACIKNC